MIIQWHSGIFCLISHFNLVFKSCHTFFHLHDLFCENVNIATTTQATHCVPNILIQSAAWLFFKSSVCLFQQSCILHIVSRWVILLRTRWDTLANIWNGDDAAPPFRQEPPLLSCEGQLPTPCYCPQGPQSVRLCSVNVLESHHPRYSITGKGLLSFQESNQTFDSDNKSDFFSERMCRFLTHALTLWLAF